MSSKRSSMKFADKENGLVVVSPNIVPPAPPALHNDVTLDPLTKSIAQLAITDPEEQEPTETDWKKAQRDMDLMFKEQSECKLQNIAKVRAPKGLTGKLYDYQRDGFRWMLHQECQGQIAPLFTLRKDGKWSCQITRKHLTGEPEPIRGSILADEMGLGKTIQTIALILANPPAGQKSYPIKTEIVPPSTDGSAQVLPPRCTLIVCPLSVMANWEVEISKFTRPGTLVTAIYHGPRRDKILADVIHHNKIDVLLASYETLAADYRNMKATQATVGSTVGGEDVQDEQKKKKKPSVVFGDRIFDVRFHRIVLDEAQNIRNSGTGSFKAVANLNCTYKLALSGTPFVNRPEDIQSLLAFLKVKPLSDPSIFKDAVTDPIRDMRAIGLKRLRATLSCFVLRRTKEDVKHELDEIKKDVIVRLISFQSEIDKKVYSTMYDAARTVFTETLAKENKLSKEIIGLVFLALTRIRQSCNHMSLLPVAVCDMVQATRSSKKGLDFEAAKVLLQKLSVDTTADSTKVNDPAKLGSSPKIDALLWAMTEMKDDEKGVVFSQWTSFLNIIEGVLKSKNIPYTRIDGTMTPQERVTALEKFSLPGCDSMDTPRFILCSVKACGTGLNMTRANHVFLMDPWWNASVENQCMDRVHRIGQTRSVRVVRFAMKESVEERMISLQDAKGVFGKGVLTTLTREEESKVRLTFLRDLFEIPSQRNQEWDWINELSDDED